MAGKIGTSTPSVLPGAATGFLISALPCPATPRYYRRSAADLNPLQSPLETDFFENLPKHCAPHCVALCNRLFHLCQKQSWYRERLCPGQITRGKSQHETRGTDHALLRGE